LVDLDSNESTSDSSVDIGVLVDTKGVEINSLPPKSEADGDPPQVPTTKSWVGVLGLTTFLSTLKFTRSSMDQFTTNISSKSRNKKARGIIQGECSEKRTEYWVVFDDICVLVDKVDNILTTGRYVKMYGQF
jgi:hypothetical protein